MNKKELVRQAMFRPDGSVTEVPAKDSERPQLWRPDEKKWWVSELCEKQLNDLFPGFLEAVVATQVLPGFSEQTIVPGFSEQTIEELWPDG